ncbi:MAG: prolyl oligopeptidase family serine peptidase [Firmicutes bacterium]|nr:prolyl oligopeptidase family serine peptidase [Bacillota bacterium]
MSEYKAIITQEDYKRAESFLPQNMRKLVFGLNITPNWFGESDEFWYKVDTRNGDVFKKVNPQTGEVSLAFDHIKLAAAISKTIGIACTHAKLPFDRFEYIDDGEAIKFWIKDQEWKCTLADYSMTKLSEKTEESKENERHEIKSPDGEWVAYVKDYNIFVRSTKTDEEIQLTFDGEEYEHYALPLPGPLESAGLAGHRRRGGWPSIRWSPDSKKIFTYKIDHRDAGRMHLVQSVPLDGSKRPLLHTYVYPLPGDENVPKASPYILDVAERKQIKVDMEPVQLLYYGGPYNWVYWTEEDDRIIMVRHERGFLDLNVFEINTQTGSTRLMMSQHNDKAVDQHDMRVLGDGKEILWVTEEDGWAHIYLYDGKTGELKNQVTSGPWVVRRIERIDEEERVVYFMAGGKEPGRDPYYCHLYRTNLDGTGLSLLTPEDAEHRVSFSPSGKFFVDVFSRVDLPPETVLRDNTGKLVAHLEKADIERLLATGWQFPERFCVKARDGVTDIYGVLIRPSNFDPNKKYPLIEYNYSGPHTAITPKSFYGVFSQDQALAELGFVVAIVDGLGMNFRSKAFQDFSYKNLGDGGFPDHIVAFRQLADRYPYIDLSRVGIYGYSAGGYAAAKAILSHPDFYKVAISWAGNVDHRTDKASWCERYMGSVVEEHYEQQSCCALAKNLKGKLYIMHGDMDENVPPASALQLVDALIKANKDFDLLILPNGVHGSGNHPYVVRKRWDYFVEHLLGAVPPKEYSIGELY